MRWYSPRDWVEEERELDNGTITKTGVLLIISSVSLNHFLSFILCIYFGD